MLVKGGIDYARGKGWFADPRGNYSFFHYARDLMEFTLGAIFLTTRPATEEAYAAAQNDPIRGSGDGVTVRAPNPPTKLTGKRDGLLHWSTLFCHSSSSRSPPRNVDIGTRARRAYRAARST